MSAKFITGILCTGALVAALAAPAPARADDADTAAAVVGTVAGLFILGKILEGIDNDHGSVRVHRDHRGPNYRHHHHGLKNGPGHAHAHATPGHTHGRNANDNRASQRKWLPGRCVKKLNVKGGVRDVMPRYCLKTSKVRVESLPSKCIRHWKGKNGHKRGYALRCLQRDGYRIRWN
jgi:hypothetical protein